MKKTNLFTIKEIEALTKFWIKENRWKTLNDDNLEAYHNGVADGAEFVLFLLERWGE